MLIFIINSKTFRLTDWKSSQDYNGLFWVIGIFTLYIVYVLINEADLNFTFGLDFL